MKLRYYLRGLGTGILVTLLITGISNGRDGLSDAEVKKRAKELGMAETSSLSLSDYYDSSAKENMEGQAAAGEKDAFAEKENLEEVSGEEKTSKEEETSTEENTFAENETSTEEETSKEEQSDRLPSSEDVQVDADDTSKAVRITIESGKDSYEICVLLEELGLVEDAKSFDNYLVYNGYSRRIRTGVYEILPGTSEEEIARIIAVKLQNPLP